MTSQQTLENLVNGHSHLTTVIKEEKETRAKADERLEQGIRQTARNIEALKMDVKQGFEIINEALNRLDAPPDKEQSPVLAQIQENIDDLFARVGNIEQFLHGLQRR